MHAQPQTVSKAAARPTPDIAGPERGFTLVELMVTLAVAVVLLSTAVPSLRTFTLRNQMATSQSAFMGTLAYARTEAARRGTAVFIVAMAGGPAGNEYANGWDVFADADADGVFGAGDGASLRHYEAPPASLVFHGPNRVTINSSGYLSPAAALSFKVCQASADVDGFLITLPPSGTADVSTLAVSRLSDCTS